MYHSSAQPAGYATTRSMRQHVGWVEHSDTHQALAPGIAVLNPGYDCDARHLIQRTGRGKAA